MPGNPATLVIKILADALGAQKGLAATATAVQKVEGTVGSLAGPAALALGGLTLLGTKAADAASDVEQAFGALESVFKDNADQAKALARSAGTDVGLATSDYAQIAAVLGAQLKGMGTAADQLVPSTDKLIDMGADLSATFGGSTADAVAAISSLLRGERDPIEKYGVSIKQADINARLAAEGLGDLTGEAKTQAETQAALAILTEKTADAQGAFARESDTAAHAQQVAAAEAQNATAALGQALLPVVVLLSGAMAELARWVSENVPLVQALVVVFGGMAVAILAINAAFKIYRAATVAVTAVQWLLNAALAANPIGLVVIAVAALVAGLILLWKNSETFRKIVTTAFETVLGVIRGVVDWITKNWPLLLTILTGPFGLMVALIVKNFDAIKAAAKAVVDFITGLFKGLADTVGRIVDTIGSIKLPSLPFLSSAPPAGRAATPRLLGSRATRAASSSGGGGIVVNVYTTGDSMEAERAVVRALRRANRLSAGVVSAPALGSN